MFVSDLRNSCMMGSLISGGKSSHLAGSARKRFTRVLELALLRFGQPGKGQAV